MDTTSIGAQFEKAVAGAQAVLSRAPAAAAPAAGENGGFASALDSALRDVSQTQLQADGMQQQFQLENPNVSLEDTMIAMNKAQISFQAAVQVRNKLVQAYDQIMQISV